MNAKQIIAKADRGEGLTEEEIKVYRQAVKPVKHVYGKYGTLPSNISVVAPQASGPYSK